MPTHLEDTYLIPHLQNEITNQIIIHPNHIYTLCGDFNRDIALRGRQNNNINTPPQEDDYQWKQFTDSLNLQYIPTNTNISRQGGYNYTSTSLIDGFYIHSPHNSKFSSTTTTHLNLNSDHYPVVLHIPHNTLIARPPVPTNTPLLRILNPIPPDNIEKFNITFFEENYVQITTLTTLFKTHQHLNSDQWDEACTILDNLVNNISDTLEKTCQADPLPILTNRTSQQGGFLPRKLAKTWQRHLNTYHLIRKTIYIVQSDPHWQAHSILNDIRNHQYTNIPHPPVTLTPLLSGLTHSQPSQNMPIKKPVKSPQNTLRIAFSRPFQNIVNCTKKTPKR